MVISPPMNRITVPKTIFFSMGSLFSIIFFECQLSAHLFCSRCLVLAQINILNLRFILDFYHKLKLSAWSLGASFGDRVTKKAIAQGSLISRVSPCKVRRASKRLQLCDRLIVINLFMFQTLEHMISALRHEARKGVF